MPSHRPLFVRWATRLGVVVFMGAAALLLSACEQTVLTLVVNTTADTPDATPGDGVCQTATGACSLRAAIQESRTVNSGRVEISLAAATTYTLTRAGANEEFAVTGDLDVSRSVWLHGNGATIDAAGLDRVFH